jgi:hypothetical protein
MKSKRAKQRFRSSPWILGGVLLGATINHVSESPLTRQLVLDTPNPVESATLTTAQNDIHIVFSTGCSPSQNWQSYVFFYHAMQVKQPGHITRIASGCTVAQQQILARRHKQQVFDKMSDKFHIHFTPGYERVGSGEPYKYFNKPFGLRHWMQNVLGFPNIRSKHETTIIAVLDPDMILTKPLLNNFSALPTETWNTEQSENISQLYVKHGYPIAQMYAYQANWMVGLGDNLKMILGNESTVFNISKFDAKLYYPAGPPYMITAWDLYDIVLTWTAIVPTVHINFPRLLGEMYAYSIAAAHHELKHNLNFGFMISNAGVQQEGWDFLKDVSPADICTRQDPENLPTVLHYCQDYSVGDHFVSKYNIPNNFLSCEAPLMQEPPRDAALKFNFSRNYQGRVRTLHSSFKRTHAFMTCSVLASLNEAAMFFKQKECGSNANYNKTWSVFPVTSV